MVTKLYSPSLKIFKMMGRTFRDLEWPFLKPKDIGFSASTSKARDPTDISGQMEHLSSCLTLIHPITTYRVDATHKLMTFF